MNPPFIVQLLLFTAVIKQYMYYLFKNQPLITKFLQLFLKTL